MSEHFITLIPTSPAFVPAPAVLEKGKEFFSRFLTGADDIEASVTNEITFVDPGENFERVCCPGCGSELGTAWWQEAMNQSYKPRFENLSVLTPCCGLATSLNDLDYRWPAGFARCRLSARSPKVTEISPEQIQELEQLLGTRLRQIWVHY